MNLSNIHYNNKIFETWILLHNVNILEKYAFKQSMIETDSYLQFFGRKIKFSTYKYLTNHKEGSNPQKTQQ